MGSIPCSSFGAAIPHRLSRFLCEPRRVGESIHHSAFPGKKLHTLTQKNDT